MTDGPLLIFPFLYGNIRKAILPLMDADVQHYVHDAAEVLCVCLWTAGWRWGRSVCVCVIYYEYLLLKYL